MSIRAKTVKISTFPCNPKFLGISFVKMNGDKWLSIRPETVKIAIFHVIPKIGEIFLWNWRRPNGSLLDQKQSRFQLFHVIPKIGEFFSWKWKEANGSLLDQIIQIYEFFKIWVTIGVYRPVHLRKYIFLNRIFPKRKFTQLTRKLLKMYSRYFASNPIVIFVFAYRKVMVIITQPNVKVTR